MKMVIKYHVLNTLFLKNATFDKNQFSKYNIYNIYNNYVFLKQFLKNKRSDFNLTCQKLLK